MADVPARTELSVTTGPIRGSRKVFVGAHKVAMRQVDLEPSAGEPPVTLYATSGPYTDPEARIDIMAGLPELRRDWIRGRGDVEEVTQRDVRPEDNGFLAASRRPDRTATAAATSGTKDSGVQPFPNVRRKVVRARAGANVSQTHYARRGIIPRKWNMSPSAKTWVEMPFRPKIATESISVRRSRTTSRPSSSATR